MVRYARARYSVAMVVLVGVLSFLFGRKRGRRRGLAEGRAGSVCDLCELPGDLRTVNLDGESARLCGFCRSEVGVGHLAS